MRSKRSREWTERDSEGGREGERERERANIRGRSERWSCPNAAKPGKDPFLSRLCEMDGNGACLGAAQGLLAS